MKAIEPAISLFLRNPDAGQFAPKPADIVKMMEESTLGSAMEAWSKVDQAIRHVGGNQTAVFDDCLIHHVISEMGGWIQLGTKTDEEWPFVRNHFVSLYKGYQVRREYPAYRRALIGIADAQNQRTGYGESPPVLIGNSAQCLEVMNGGNTGPTREVTRPSNTFQISYDTPQQPLRITLATNSGSERCS